VNSMRRDEPPSAVIRIDQIWEACCQPGIRLFDADPHNSYLIAIVVAAQRAPLIIYRSRYAGIRSSNQ
jgi:hypothetical protein